MQTLDLPEWLPTPSEHFLLATAAVLVYIVNARARRERRAPAAAIAWVMGLALLPYLMLPLYLAFGQRKIRIPPAQPVGAVVEPAHWATSLLRSFGLAGPAPSQVRFHADGVEARAALWRVIDGARDSLDVCTFVIGDDLLGREALRRLAARARAGVKVRLMYDGLIAWSAPRQAVRALEAAGGEVLVFRPLFSPRSSGPRNLRNHRKFVIADTDRLWTGGRNLATEYFTGEGAREAWIDLSFDLEGEVARRVSAQFARDWDAAGAGRIRPTVAPIARVTPPASGGTLAQFLPSGPDQADDTAQSLLIAACFHAEHRLLAITPYFVPDTALQHALSLAVRRGVKVTLAIPAVSNHRIADFVRGRPLRELAHAGADIRLLPAMCHAKAVVVDDTLAMCGSINLDARSLLLNYEAAVVFYGAAEIDWLAGWIAARAAEGRTFDARPVSLLRDLAEGALLAVAFQV